MSLNESLGVWTTRIVLRYIRTQSTKVLEMVNTLMATLKILLALMILWTKNPFFLVRLTDALLTILDMTITCGSTKKAFMVMVGKMNMGMVPVMHNLYRDLGHSVVPDTEIAQYCML